MKRSDVLLKKCMGILLASAALFVFGSCTNVPSQDPSPTNSQETVSQEPAETSFDASLFRNQDSGPSFISGRFFLETDRCYYVLRDEYIYYSAKETPDFHILCSRPDCNHNDENCNAYGDMALGWFDGKLYCVSVLSVPLEDRMRLGLVRMDEDGRNHERLAYLDITVSPSGQVGGYYFFGFHKGYLYFYVDAKIMYRVSLKTGEIRQILDGLIGDSNLVNSVRIAEDNMYLVLNDIAEDQYSLYEYGLSDGKIRLICPWMKNRLHSWTVEDGVLYFYNEENRAFTEMDLKTGDTSVWEAALPDHHNIFYDDDWIYVSSWEEELNPVNQTFEIYDRSYKLIDRLILQGKTVRFFSASDKLFFSPFLSNPVRYYLPKSDFGKGNLELKDVNSKP